MVIWMIGMSGAGKSTLGRELVQQWREITPNVVMLDGDELRGIFRSNLGEDSYTVEGRRKNAEQIAALCRMLDLQGIHVVCCILSIFADMRAQNRKIYSQYYEVFMDAPLEVLSQRDVKGLYSSYHRGETKNVVGLDIDFVPPATADMVIDSSGSKPDLKNLASKILSRVLPP